MASARSAEATNSLEAMNTIHLFFQFLDRGDGAGLAGLFTADGVLELKSVGKTYRGSAELSQFVKDVQGMFPKAQHWEGNVVIGNAGGVIRNDSYWKAEVGAETISRGTHEDLLTVEDGRVLFKKRVVVHTWSKSRGFFDE